jgi:RNA recognition motif-containing protein
MSKKLFVSNISFTMTEESLQELFAGIGEVASARIIKDHHTGRSKGFGFVEMNSDSEAADAISKLNGTEIDGRTITVAEARPQQPRENSSYGGGGGGNRRPRN